MPELAYNRLIRELLGWLAVLYPQVGPVELCCMWFDDLYFPGQSEWRSCFGEDELQALAAFHAAFASEVDTLPVKGRWQQYLGWRRVSEAARAALEVFERHSDAPA